MEVDDFDLVLSGSGPMPTNPELQPEIGVWNLVPPAVDPPVALPYIGDDLNQSSQRQQPRHRYMQLTRNQDVQLPRPRSLPPPNTQLQHHPRQSNSPIQNSILSNPNVNTTSPNETGARLVNMGASRPSQGSTNLHTNIDSGVSRESQNLITGISTDSPVEQRPSIPQSLRDTLVQNLQLSRQILTHYEQALEQARPQVMLVVSARNIEQLQTIRKTLAETEKKCRMDREIWAHSLVYIRTQERGRDETFIKDIEEAVDRAKRLCSEYETFGRYVENLLGLLRQQQQQTPLNPNLNPGLGSGDDGAGPQIPQSFPDTQNPSLNAQTPVQYQQMMNAAQNRVGENPPNYNLGGASPPTRFHQNLQALQNHPDNHPPGANMPPNVAQNQSDPHKAHFNNFLASEV
ncbi:hypothetical protein CPB86DRAFT_781988 [Serendipita vermifera]|nr:hypothetical protein CPB86DRAFT_781988 [Serendipita vermifera]